MQEGRVNIPLVDLKAQYVSIEGEVNAAVRQVMEKCDFILGGAVRDFEAAFARHIEVPHCLGVASGTDALHLALRALEIGPGDEVLVPANTYIATALAVTQVGAKPVLVDVDAATFNMDMAKAEKKITRATKAVIPVHLYGQAADMDAAMAMAARHGLKVVEDACQAHGARYKGRRCGSFGDYGCFSFYPGKNLGAYGDGGAITTRDAGLAKKIELLRNYGQEVKYKHLLKGYNSRLDTIQAAILKVKLERLAAWTAARIRNAGLYGRYLSGTAGVTLPQYDPKADSGHVFHLYVVRTQRRDELLDFLKGQGVFCGIHYPIPIHLLDAYRDLGHAKGDFPVTEKAAQEIISLPMYAELTEEQIKAVAGAIKAFVAAK
jgi:dTDP-4-amino-4,6-dideoxygalactose transaminase